VLRFFSFFFPFFFSLSFVSFVSFLMTFLEDFPFRCAPLPFFSAPFSPPPSHSTPFFVHTLGTWLTELRLSACAGYSWDRHDAIFLSFHLFFPPCAWAWDVYSLFNENPLEMGGEGR